MWGGGAWRRWRAAGRLRPFFTVFLVFPESELDVIKEVVVGGLLTKFIRRAVPDHKAVELVALQVGDLQYDGAVKAVVDVFILFFLDQSSLERLYTFGPGEAEHVDQLVQIDPYAGAIGAGAIELESRFFKVEDPGVILPVLNGVAAVIPGHYLYGFHFNGVDVQGDIKPIIIIERSYGIAHGGLTEIREIDRVVVIDSDGIVAEGICGGASARGGQDADTVQRFCPVHIVHGAMYGDLAPGLAAEKEG